VNRGTFRPQRSPAGAYDLAAEQRGSAPTIALTRFGAFSGSAISLRNSLEGLGLQVVDIDHMAAARDPLLVPARLLASCEAWLMAPPATPWPRSRTWARALEWRMRHRTAGVQAAVVVQTIAAAKPQVPYVVYTDRVSLESRQVDREYRSTFTDGWLAKERRLLRGARRVFVMGPSTVPWLTAQYGVDASRVQVVGAAANTTLGPPVPVRPACRRLLFVGTQWDLKGGEELLAAFRTLRRDFPDLVLDVVGCVPPRVPDGVRVHGRLAHTAMDTVYEQADLLVLPTRSEAFGIAFLEALEKGLPCVGTSVANVPWIVGDAGLCVAPRDIPALCQAIRTLIDNYSEFAARARLRGAQLSARWTWQRIAAQVADALP
jgi:glycosyltransferase involved in cell wall biosynthesis